MIKGIKGFNRAGTSTNVLLAAYGNDVVNVLTGAGYGLNIADDTDVHMDVFLDRVFIQNYDMVPKSFDGTTWNSTYVGRCMTSKYIKSFASQARIYLGFCKFTAPQVPLDVAGNPVTFPSRVFHSDLYIGNNLTWGMEWGTNGVTSSGSPYFNIVNPLAQNFISSNIKVGDPLVITSGDSTLINKTYYVKEVISPHRLEMTENFEATASSLHYWVGSNWFDVGTDSNDSITAMGENNSTLLVYKLFSMFSYNGSSLRQVPDALGTSSAYSVMDTKTGTYYFHGSDPNLSGIYRYDGSQSNRVSRQIDPFIRGMSASNYTNVVTWREGDELRFFLGDLSNTNYDISMTDAVATLNTAINGWDVSPIAHNVISSTNWNFGNENRYYGLSDEGEVFKMGVGNSFNDIPISYKLQTKILYPTGTEVINEFPRIQVVGRATKGVRVKYKLWNMPKQSDLDWLGLGELSEDKTELIIPMGHKFASGIQVQFEGMDTLENDVFIEKLTVFYTPQRTRLL